MNAAPLIASPPAAARLAVRDGDAAGRERPARVGAVDVAAVRRVACELAEAALLRAQVGAARLRRRRSAEDRRRAHRQRARVASLRRRAARAHRCHHGQDRHEHRERLRRHGTTTSCSPALSLALSLPVGVVTTLIASALAWYL
jgi:hypothetical protein